MTNQALAELVPDPKQAKGLWLTIKTKKGKTFQGQVFEYEPPLLAIQSVAKGRCYNFDLINTNTIDSAHRIDPIVPTPPLASVVNLPLPKLRSREDKAIQLDKERSAKHGVGVSSEAQVVSSFSC